MTSFEQVAHRYDTALSLARHTHLPPGYLVPQPTAAWPSENIELLVEFRQWLLSGGGSPHTADLIDLPMAGHVLGLFLQPHPALRLMDDLTPAMDYILAKRMSSHWTKVCRNGLEKFARFLRQKRGQVAVPAPLPDPAVYEPLYSQGLPEWLVGPLRRQHQLKQCQWRAARLAEQGRRFWKSHTEVWRWLAEAGHPLEPMDIKRSDVDGYIDARLAVGDAVSTINHNLLCFQASLRLLQAMGQAIPPRLLARLSLKQPDRLPRHLTDEQMGQLQRAVEQAVGLTQQTHEQRNALLLRAAFYLMWHGGLRLGEVEELQLTDLNLGQLRLTVRRGKGLQDRTVYLTERAVAAVQAYLMVRGDGPSNHVFLYRHRALRKDLLRDRLKAIGLTVGVAVTPHQLRHTCATQLLNRGCPVTTIQRLLGHKRLNSTMVYARVHDQTVADDYFTAMAQIEQAGTPPPDRGSGPDPTSPVQPLLALVEQLPSAELTPTQQAAIKQLQTAFSPPPRRAREGVDTCPLNPREEGQTHG